MDSYPAMAVLILVFVFLSSPAISVARPISGGGGAAAGDSALPRFAEAPQFRNGDDCPISTAGEVCDPTLVHIAMTLDAHYLRGSMAAVFSLLKHASCPESIFFHFITSGSGSGDEALAAVVSASFPSLRFRIYPFPTSLVSDLISSSVRAALENPLNYARNHLADLLPSCVSRVIYLDSDILAVDDARRLWETHLPAAAVVAAPQYCHANFTRYFTPAFWNDPELGFRVFEGRRRQPCYFNTGVMLIDLRRWRAGNYRNRIEKWMRLQKERRIYELGSLPPFLLEFAGEVEGVDHRWNQHGLGGDNLTGTCRPLHPGPVSLMHWSGKGKPWARLDAGRPCPLDRLWAPYDLYISPASAVTAASMAPSSSSSSSSIFSW